jgi:hypothetical protein
MKKPTSVTSNQPAETSNDPLTDLLRSGAKSLLMEAIHVEVDEYISILACLRDESGWGLSSRTATHPPAMCRQASVALRSPPTRQRSTRRAAACRPISPLSPRGVELIALTAVGQRHWT